MKKFKRIMALVIALAMVMGLMSLTAFAADAGTYTITVTNSNSTVSIDGMPFKAVKLFDVTYADPATPANTTHGNDTAPHAYYLATNSPFYDGTSYDATTGAWTYGSYTNIIKDYFDFTYLSTDTTKILVEPKKDNSGNSTFNEAKAYEMTDLLSRVSGFDSIAGISANANGNTAEIDVSANGPGYYLVTGSGHPKKEDGSVDTSKTVTAAVALTTTDPKAKIAAKLDAVTLEKEIDEGANKGKLENDDVKEDNHSVGDNVPFILETTVPNMTGYEKYFFVVNDTLSKGLTFKNDVAVKFVKEDGTEDKVLVKDTDYTVTSTGGSGSDTQVKIVFKNFIQWKGELVRTENYASLGLTDSDIGTYYGSYTGDKIVITYSADVNSYAVIGDIGNSNTAKLTYSNNPNEDYDHDNTTDEPSSKDKTGDTPDSVTKTYVSGLSILKYTKDATDNTKKNPLADATFTLEGENLNSLVETTTTYFREITGTETGTHYLLTDGTYTTDAPITDIDNPNYNAASYVPDDPSAETKTYSKKYIQDTVKTWSKEGTKPSVKYTVKTDSEGLMTFTGLAAGTYTLTETEAPAGYNKLDKPIIITITETGEDQDVTNTHTWSATYKVGEDGTATNLDLTAPNLFELDVENNAGTELPSTGGIGTTIFYVVGAILVIGAGVVLITRRRMDA